MTVRAFQGCEYLSQKEVFDVSDNSNSESTGAPYSGKLSKEKLS